MSSAGPGKSVIHSDTNGIGISWVEPDPDPSVDFRWRLIRSIPYTSRSIEIRFSIPLQDLQDGDGTFWYLLETLSFGETEWDSDDAWITNVVHAPGHVVLGNNSVPFLGEQTFEGMATTWQAGGESRGTLRRGVVLSFNQFEEVATLQMDERYSANVSDVRLRCASASEIGPVVWAQSGTGLPRSVSIEGRDLAILDASSAGCVLAAIAAPLGARLRESAVRRVLEAATAGCAVLCSLSPAVRYANQ